MYGSSPRCIDCGHGRTDRNPGWYEVAQANPGCDCCQEYYHCSECGQPEVVCQCCSYCEIYHGDDECGYEESYASPGYSPSAYTAPWFDQDGFVPESMGDWDDVWHPGHKEIDPAQAACDFFLLISLAQGVPGFPTGSADHANVREMSEMRLIMAEAKIRTNSLVSYLAGRFADYIDMAVGGELRHHRRCSEGYGTDGGLNGNRRRAWAEWKSVRVRYGAQALIWAQELFTDGTMPGGYGGDPWAQAASLLWQYETGAIPAEVFVNYTFNLVHNNGCFLNKLDWKRDNEPGWGLDEMRTVVLPAHAFEGSAEKMPWHVLLAGASKDVRALWNEYFGILREVRRDWGMRTLPTPRPASYRAIRNWSRYEQYGHDAPKYTLTHTNTY